MAIYNDENKTIIFENNNEIKLVRENGLDNFLTFHTMKDLIDSKKVIVKEKNNLSIFKYSKSVFFNQDFNDERILECRGRINDKEGNIVSLPFKKIFNHGEKFCPEIDLNEEVIAVEKINGFMLAMTKLESGELLFSTTGSLENEYIEMGKEFLKNINSGYLKKGQTYLFEVCHKNDPHIIEEREGIYLIGVRNIKTKELEPESFLDITVKYDFFGNDGYRDYLLGVKRPKWKKCLFKEVLEEMKTCKHEGYIVQREYYDLDANETKVIPLCKLKSDWYRFCKVLARSKDSRCLSKAEVFTRDNKEYLEVFEFVKNNKEIYFSLNEQNRLKALREKRIPEIVYYGDLILLRGLPGSGKTTLAENIKDKIIGVQYVHYGITVGEVKSVVIEADQYFYDEFGNYNFDRSKLGEAHNYCRSKCVEALNHGVKTVFVSNTFTTEKEIEPYREIAHNFGYRFTTLIVENRHNNESIHNVPKDTIEAMRKRFSIKL